MDRRIPTETEAIVTSRSQRRPSRRRPHARASSREAKPKNAVSITTLAAAAVALVGVVGVAVVIASVLASGEDTSDQGAISGDEAAGTSDEGLAPIDQGAAASDEQGTTDGRQAIESLARRSIEVLPAGQWPSLYDSFTSEFQQRCPREEFDQAGMDSAA